MNQINSIDIRDARSDERPAMVAVTLAAYAQYAAVMPHWDSYQAMLRRLLAEDETAERIVAECAGEVVGSVLLYPASATVYATASANADWPELRMLAVTPAARGLGVGRALLAECIRRAGAAGSAYLGLHTEDAMAVALRMYEHSGFERVPALDFNPAPGVVVKGYRLALNPPSGNEG